MNKKTTCDKYSTDYIDKQFNKMSRKGANSLTGTGSSKPKKAKKA